MSEESHAETFKIRATPGPKLLSNIDRYFVNDIETIAVELLQNCRRAGASDVVVTSDATSITIADDGCGIEKDRAHLLLSFGGSGNSDIVEHDERAAGMGFASLARRGATVRSADWEMTLSPEAFKGEVDVELRPSEERIKGTRITFPVAKGSFMTEVEAIQDAASYMPFRTKSRGDYIWKQSIADRFKDRKGGALFDDMIETPVGDCIVTVARFERQSHRWLNRRHPTEGHGVKGYGDRDRDGETEIPMVFVEVDIFGQILSGPDVDRLVLPQELGKHFEGKLTTRSSSGFHEEVAGYAVTIEALGANTVVTRLPDRRSLVATDGLAEVKSAILDAICRMICRSKRHALLRSAQIRKRCEELDLQIPPGQTILCTFVQHPDVCPSYRPITVDVLDRGTEGSPLPDGTEVIIGQDRVIAGLIHAANTNKANMAAGKRLLALFGSVSMYDMPEEYLLDIDGTKTLLTYGNTSDAAIARQTEGLVFQDAVRVVDSIKLIVEGGTEFELDHAVLGTEHRKPRALFTRKGSRKAFLEAAACCTNYRLDDDECEEIEGEDVIEVVGHMLKKARMKPGPLAASMVMDAVKKAIHTDMTEAAIKVSRAPDGRPIIALMVTLADGKKARLALDTSEPDDSP